MIERIEKALRHPLAPVSAGIAWISSGIGLLDPVFAMLDVAWAIVGTTAGTWFPLLGVLSTIAETVAIVPASATRSALAVGGVVYALYLSNRLLDRLRNKIEEVRQ